MYYRIKLLINYDDTQIESCTFVRKFEEGKTVTVDSVVKDSFNEGFIVVGNKLINKSKLRGITIEWVKIIKEEGVIK